MSRVLLIAVAALSLGSPAFAEASAGEPKSGQDDVTAGRRLADAVKRQDSNTIDALLSGAVNVNTPQERDRLEQRLARRGAKRR